MPQMGRPGLSPQLTPHYPGKQKGEFLAIVTSPAVAGAGNASPDRDQDPVTS